MVITMDVSQYKQFLPKELKGRKQNNLRYIRSVICVYLLTIIQPEYKKITCKEFTTNFQKYVQLTESEDDPCLYYQSGKRKGELKIPNQSTFADTWMYRYNVKKLFSDFRTNVVKHMAKTILEDQVLYAPHVIETERESYNNNQQLQQNIFNDKTTPDVKKPYPIKATQESKSISQNIINDSVERVQDYLDIQNQAANSGEVYNPNHDRIIDKYHNLENEWEED